mgnify:CR=1 FL=1
MSSDTATYCALLDSDKEVIIEYTFDNIDTRYLSISSGNGASNKWDITPYPGYNVWHGDDAVGTIDVKTCLTYNQQLGDCYNLDDVHDISKMFDNDINTLWVCTKRV